MERAQADVLVAPPGESDPVLLDEDENVHLPGHSRVSSGIFR